MKEYQVCKRCVMDNRSDETITFDEQGICNYCTNAISDIGKLYFPNEEGERRLKEMIDKIKADGVGKEYDCMMGLSGGLDSSYLAYLGYKWGLRICAVHVDDGYDTQISKDNIEKLCKAANIKLITISPDAEQFNDLTRAFLLAGVPNLAVPQDNILFAVLLKFAKKHKIHYFLSGGNFALESILQNGNTHTAYDMVNTKDIHKKFGTKPMNKLQFISDYQRQILRYVHKIESLRPLDLIDYNRERAFKELKDFCGFEYYGGKHLENILTKFIQTYYFPKKFNVDKRTSHLSSMIVSGQMTREEAIEEMKKPLYDEVEMEKDIEMILGRLNLTREQLDDIMKQPPKQHTDYKTSNFSRNLKVAVKVVRFFRRKRK